MKGGQPSCGKTWCVFLFEDWREDSKIGPVGCGTDNVSACMTRNRNDGQAVSVGGSPHAAHVTRKNIIGAQVYAIGSACDCDVHS